MGMCRKDLDSKYGGGPVEFATNHKKDGNFKKTPTWRRMVFQGTRSLVPGNLAEPLVSWKEKTQTPSPERGPVPPLQPALGSGLENSLHGSKARLAAWKVATIHRHPTAFGAGGLESFKHQLLLAQWNFEGLGGVLKALEPRNHFWVSTSSKVGCANPVRQHKAQEVDRVRRRA